MNYKIVFDGIYSSIVETERKPSEHNEIYPTFAKAKKELLIHMRKQRDDWKEAIHRVQSINKHEI